MKIRDKYTRALIGLYAVIVLMAAYTGYRLWLDSRMESNLYFAELGHFQGPADAEKVIVEFLDYRCSFCREVHPVMQAFLKRNPDVKIIYRHLAVFGRPSVIDAEVALAAGMQGKFAAAHNALMQLEQPMSDREIEELALSLGLDLEKFRKDMKGPEIGHLLLGTVDMASAMKIGSVPAFLVGGKLYTLKDGMPTVETFEQLLKDHYGS